MTSLSFAVIGAGRLGASIALALRAKGLRLAAYSAATPAGRLRAQALLSGTPSPTLKDLVAQDPDLFLITVPDSALDEVSDELGRLLVSRADRWVAHTSGATSVDVLRRCALSGATTFKLHPLQTFADPAVSSRRFAGITVAITPSDGGTDSPGGRMGFALARLLDAKPFLLVDEDRALYHAAATMACNYFVTLEHLACGLFVESGLPSDEARSSFLPLVDATLDNLRRDGASAALTGPLSRGDVETVRGHLAALSTSAPSLLPVYRELGLATLDIVRARGDVDDARLNELAGLLTRMNGNLTNTRS